jgi:hypothetical protein
MREHQRGDNLMLLLLLGTLARFAWPYPEVVGLWALVNLVAIIYWTCRGIRWVWVRFRLGHREMKSGAK